MLRQWNEEKPILSRKMDLSKSDFESYIEQLKLSIKSTEMALKANKVILVWAKEELKKFPEPKKKIPPGIR